MANQKRPVHYRPTNRWVSYCGVEQQLNRPAGNIKTHTDVGMVTCPACVEAIRKVIDGVRPKIGGAK